MNKPIREVALAGLFAALTAVGAQLSFKLPITGVPFTLQVLTVLLAGLLLGPRWGALSMVGYLVLGAAGLPVFSGFGSGLGRLLGPTAGYLWSFPAAAAVTGWLAARTGRPAFWPLLLATLPGLSLVYVGGAGWAMLVGGEAAGKVLAGWVLPFIPYDLAKCALAAAVAQSVHAALGAMGWRRAA